MVAVSRHSPQKTQKKTLKRKLSDNETDEPAGKKMNHEKTLPKPTFMDDTLKSDSRAYSFGQSVLPPSKNDTPVDERTLDGTNDTTMTETIKSKPLKF